MVSGLVLCAWHSVAYEPGTAACAPLRPRAKQRQLPLLGIKAHQGPHNFLLHQDLVLRLPRVELPGLDPLRVGRVPQGQFALCLGNLFLEGDHRRFLLAGQGQTGP